MLAPKYRSGAKVPITKKILCLANSKKNSGRCVAGREVLAAGPGPWVRPVSVRESEEVSENERQYKDGSDPKVLDVLDVPLVKHHPHACQTENWVLDDKSYWTKVGQVGWKELQGYVENPAALWINGQSTYHGQNDEITRAAADKLPSSLFLVRTATVELKVMAPSAAFGNPKRRVLGVFEHHGPTYAFWVTDPVIEREYLAKPDGSYKLGESCLCLSLGEPFTKKGVEYRYKLIAAIIQKASVPS
jgi:hypothetical protein